MDLRTSLDRVLRSAQLLGVTFYQHLFEHFPEVRPFFEKVDLKRQQILLTMAVSVIAQHFLHRYPATQKYLAHLGTHHHDRGIPEQFLPHFRDALLATLAQALGPEWSDELAGQWREAIDLACQEMGTGYRQRMTV